MSTSTRSPFWPDTTDVAPPVGHPYATARWLLGRHPQLAALLERLPGVVDVDDVGMGWLDLRLVGDALAALEAHELAWDDYRRCTREPREDTAWQAWSDAGPALPGAPVGPVVDVLTELSDSELLRVRLLGCWAPGGARLPLISTSRLDDSGRRLLTDWTTAVLAH